MKANCMESQQMVSRIAYSIYIIRLYSSMGPLNPLVIATWSSKAKVLLQAVLSHCHFCAGLAAWLGCGKTGFQPCRAERQARKTREGFLQSHSGQVRANRLRRRGRKSKSKATALT